MESKVIHDRFYYFYVTKYKIGNFESETFALQDEQRWKNKIS